jgi:hypothetical protein
MKPQLIVVNEHTLAISRDGVNYEVLRASILRGATSGIWPEPNILSSLDKVRLASEKDFDDYRVSFKGYNSNDYHYSK